MAHTTDASYLLSSQVGPSKNILPHDHIEISRKVLPSRTTIVTPEEFLDLLVDKQQMVNESLMLPSTSNAAAGKGSKDSTKTSTLEDLMNHLNKLSKLVRKQQSGK